MSKNTNKPQFSRSRIEGSVGDPIPGFIDNLEAIHDMEMTFPKLPKGKICFFGHLKAALK